MTDLIIWIGVMLIILMTTAWFVPWIQRKALAYRAVIKAKRDDV